VSLVKHHTGHNGYQGHKGIRLGLGAGAELQKPPAIAVIGGLSLSTIVTLVFVPAILSFTSNFRQFFSS
jgi:multidrug efflux pump subunit AcrB